MSDFRLSDTRLLTNMSNFVHVCLQICIRIGSFMRVHVQNFFRAKRLIGWACVSVSGNIMKIKLIKEGEYLIAAMAEMGLMTRTPAPAEQEDYLLMRQLEEDEERISVAGKQKLAELQNKFYMAVGATAGATEQFLS